MKIEKFKCHRTQKMPSCEKYAEKGKLCLCFSEKVRHLEKSETFKYNPETKEIFVRSINDADKYRLTEREVCICEADIIDRNEANDHEYNVTITGHVNDAGGYCCPHHGNTCGAHNW